ncbi:MAG TPA: TIGR02677 family protein [Pirellulales bacterium]|nr:TIGR02677 family protein [Pirellulales bacterium]
MSQNYSQNGNATNHIAKGVDPHCRDPFECFSYLTVEKTLLYRSIVEIFLEAKAGFHLHLRPADVVLRLSDKGEHVAQDETEIALDALVGWGNLQSYHDTADVATVADFHRRRLLYQLTATGEAAGRAATSFLETLDQSVVLEAAALARIRDHLAELLTLVDDSQPDAGKLLTILRAISIDTEQLTEHAQSFFRWLHEQTEGPSADLDAFLLYKERLIDYLRRFLAELTCQAGAIAARLEMLQPKAEPLLQAAAGQEASAAFAKDEADRAAISAASERRWRQRWHGLRHWFVGVEGDPQVKQLRAAAGAAIPRLLALAAQLHDRRATRSDRRADLVELATWFVEAADDRQAHTLWRAAFGISPARHLTVNQTALDQEDARPIRSGTSWLDAPGVYISPRLRQAGLQPAAVVRRVVSRAAELAELRNRAEIENRRASLARSSLVALGPRRLAEVGQLHHEALLILLDLLDRAAAVSNCSAGPIAAYSEDGSLRIQVDRNVARRVATIETSEGYLHLRDALICVEHAGTD